MKTEPDEAKKSVKLTPIKKSGKEKHIIYKDMDDEEDYDLVSYKKRESVLDYYDDGEDDYDEDTDDEESYDDDEEYGYEDEE